MSYRTRKPTRPSQSAGEYVETKAAFLEKLTKLTTFNNSIDDVPPLNQMEVMVGAGTDREARVKLDVVVYSKYRYETEYFTVVPSQGEPVRLYRPSPRAVRRALVGAIAPQEMQSPQAQVGILPPTSNGIKWALLMSATSLQSVLKARMEQELLQRTREGVLLGSTRPPTITVNGVSLGELMHKQQRQKREDQAARRQA